MPRVDRDPVASISPTSTPYRKSAAPAPRRPSPWPGRLASTLAVGTILGVAMLGVWYALPWKVHAELRPAHEALPSHERIHAVWWSDWGWALAAGEKGQVFVRAGRPQSRGSRPVVPPSRSGPRRLSWPSPAGDSTLDAGRGNTSTPSSWGTAPSSTARRPRAASSTWTIARAVAYAGGEALVVGDGGLLERVVPWYTNRNVPLGTGTGLRAWDERRRLEFEQPHSFDLTANLRAVDFTCDDDAERCEAALWSAQGVVAGACA